MSENIKSYRVRTRVGEDTFVSVNLEQDYDTFDILSLKIKSADTYRLHNSNYGVIVGRVLANNGFGVPNAKISVFIKSDTEDDVDISAIYPFSTTASKDENGVRYNLLPDTKVGNCHQVVGTFPNKRYMLDNDDVLEVFDKYYKYTTRTNNAGDYMICGVPTGEQTLHMDLDLSDCGILSQRPRDFVYKGYTIEQFENPNMFKSGTEFQTLSQIFTQDQVVHVQPFWGNESLGETIGITRADINVAFKFEPTCVFMGCVASDNASQGISKKCIPTEHMGDMDELTTGEGTIEMIRKTYAGAVEEFQVKGTELIDGNGVWCYQIPMNLDYMMTDEYGNMVPTDNPERGIPTRTRVRFRISMQDMEQNTDNYFRAKVLVPHNPQNLDGSDHEDYDYEFGTYTRDESFRDLFWNNVYTVKSYIPRFQKRKVSGWKEKRFTGIKHCQDFGSNNPIPYNNIRINLPFMFKIMCILIKTFIKVAGVINTVISLFGNFLANLGDTYIGFRIGKWNVGFYPFKKQYEKALDLKMNVIDEGLCPDLENWYFSPMALNTLWISPKKQPKGMKPYNLLKQTLESINTDDDPYSVDDENQDDEDLATCLTIDTDYLISCVEMNLAQEYKVINFDFYNDWINGLIYFPRWMKYTRNKVTFLGITWAKAKVKACMDNTKIFGKTRRYTQLCSLGYGKQTVDSNTTTYSKVTTNLKNKLQITKSNNLHKKRGLSQVKIFGKNGGICHEKPTMVGQYVYYLKPCEWTLKTAPLYRKVNLFATDLVLLGSLNDCDMYGVPQAFKHLSSSSYIMPTNLALTNMESDGPLYAFGKNGTMCSKTNQTTVGDTEEDLARPMIRRGNDSLTEELKYYSGASSNYDLEYDDESDTIPITEAAGISWNWNGPQQGETNKKKLYYPGGHFLGLSCVNSQTNIKSCINLERICELGTAMSQRKEDVRAVDSDEFGEPVLKYVYSVPTGLISGDDIIDDEFRVMFATMNHKRLIATKLNRETGYKTYDFDFVNPVNFSGELSKYTKIGTPYNEKVTVEDESDGLKIFGILFGNKRDDWDADEPENTQRKTTESTSVDYYMFRLGLDYANLQKKGNPRHIRQFAKEENGNMYLPQYENSFYFYFGMKNGSTALDEFNKQFFSECESSTLMEREPAVTITMSDFSLCEGTSIVNCTVENMEEPYRYILRNSTGETLSAKTSIFDTSFDLGKLSKEDYIITVADSEGMEVEGKFSVGRGALKGLFNSYDFNLTLSNGLLNRENSNKNIYYGGYVNVEGALIEGVEPSTMTVYAVADMTAVEEVGIKAETSQKCDENGNAVLYLASANTAYDIYVKYKYVEKAEDLEEGETPKECKEVFLYAATLTLKDTSTVGLTMGSVMKIPYLELPGSGFTKEWWQTNATTIGDDAAGELKHWNIRKSIINECANSGDTFSNNVMAQNGTKAVWGTPQNINGWAGTGITAPSYSSEYEDNIPVGSTLDDDASYYPTYGISQYKDIRQYNAISYNGGVVCGDFAAIATGNDLIKNVTEIIPNRLRNNEGCILKPVPDGDLIPCTYINGNIYCSGDTEEIRAAVSGVVYPTINYPVIKKPFEVNANYFVIQDKEIKAEKNDDGNTEIVIFNGDKGKKCESHIFNGLTYKQQYGGESIMTMISGDTEDYVPGSTNIRVNNGDLYGLSSTSIPEVKKYLSAYTEDELEEFGYSIIEGYPLYVQGSGYVAYDPNPADDKLFKDSQYYANEADSAELSMDTIFYDNIFYDVELGNAVFSGIGRCDRDVEFYYLNSAVTGSFFVQPNSNYDKYITLRKGRDLFGILAGEQSPRNLYVLGYYTEKAEYDIVGQEMMVHLRDTGFKIKAYVPWSEDSEEEGIGMVMHSRKISSANIIRESEIERMLEEIEDWSGNRIKFFKKKNISENSFKCTEEETYSWTQGLLSKCVERNLIQQNRYNGTLTEEFCIVGVKRFEDDKRNTGNMCKIYLYPPKIKKNYGVLPSVAVSSSNTKIELVTEIEFENTANQKTFYAMWQSGVSWTATVDANSDWIHISPTTGAICTAESAVTAFTISVSANNSNKREGTIKFVDNEGGESIVTVKQKEAIGYGMENGIWTSFGAVDNTADNILLGSIFNENGFSAVKFEGRVFPSIEVTDLNGSITLKMVLSTYSSSFDISDSLTVNTDGNCSPLTGNGIILTNLGTANQMNIKLVVGGSGSAKISCSEGNYSYNYKPKE